jgi:hypothetical protein
MTLTGCEELEVDDKGAVSAATFYADENTLDPAVIGIYAIVRRGTWALDQLAPYYGADDLTSRTGSNKAPVLEADQFSRTPGNGWVTNTYNYYYQAILACNSFIEGATPVAETLGEDVVNPYLADAYFIRGFCYFYLATCFKDVPMPLEAAVDAEMSRTPYAGVMAQVISDLEYAEKWLDAERDTNPTAAVGKATKTAAKAYLAKANMQLTGYPTNENDKWAQVKSYSKQIIDAGVYSLMDDFEANFRDPEQINKENIFLIMNYRGAWPAGAQCRYHGFKWRDWGDCYVEHKYADRFPDGYRRHVSMVTDDDVANKTDLVTKEWAPFLSTWNHPMVRKFWYQTVPGTENYLHKWQTDNDVVFMRTAEVYLMYAEACARTGDTGEAEKYLNYVRRRAYAQGLTTREEVAALPSGFWMEADAAVDYTAAEGDLADAIVEERSYEFLGETGGNRWLDLVRLETVGDVNNYRKTATNEEEMIGDPNNKDLWWTPIPGTEIVLNPNL